GTLTGITGKTTGILALPGFTQLFEPVDTTLAQRLIDIAARQPSLRQFLTDTLRTVAGACPIGDKAFQIAGLREQALFGQALQRSLDHFLGGAALAQLARQFDAPMFTSRQQIHGRSPDGKRIIQYDEHALTA